MNLAMGFPRPSPLPRAAPDLRDPLSSHTPKAGSSASVNRRLTFAGLPRLLTEHLLYVRYPGKPLGRSTPASARVAISLQDTHKHAPRETEPEIVSQRPQCLDPMTFGLCVCGVPVLACSLLIGFYPGSPWGTNEFIAQHG